MSLLSEPDYVLQCLRLQFLRRSNDTLGPSIITFPESFSSHILHSDLNDIDVWPELGIVRSPDPVAQERPTRRAKKVVQDGSEGAAGLNYSETIVGDRTGRAGAGMRVGGRTRSWVGKAASLKGRSVQASDAPQGKGKGRERQSIAEENEEASSEEDPDETMVDESARTSPFGGSLHDGLDEEAQDSIMTLRNNPAQGSSHLRPRSSLKRTDSRAKRIPPLVTIQSPVTTPQDSPVPPQTPAEGDEYDSESTANQGFDSDTSEQARRDRRSRPVTLMNPPAYAHDKELSDALRWQADGPTSLDDQPTEDPPSSTSPVFSMRPSKTDRDTDMGQEDLAAEMGTQPSRNRVSDVDDPSSLETFSFIPGPATQDEYDFMSTSSALSAASPIIKDMRGRRSGFRLEPSNANKLTQSDDITQAQIPTDASSAAAAAPLPPAAPAIGRKRERRRVNISGKFLPLQAPAGMPAFRAIPEETDATDNNAPPVSPTTTRARADTEPKQSPFVQQPMRRQASSDGLARDRNALTTRPSATALNQDFRKRALSNVSARNRSASDLSSQPPGKTGLDFSRARLKPQIAGSALTALLSQKANEDISSNPYTSQYGALVMRSPIDGLKLKLFFPHCGGSAARKPLEIKIRKDVTVEEVIGSGLWTYWEEGRDPPLISEAEKAQWDGQELKGMLDPARWNLMIVEDDDGEVDDDFPALERIRNISAFAFPAFAIVEANPTQYHQNQIIQAQIQRRPSRIINTQPKMLNTSAAQGDISPGLLPPSASTMNIDADLMSTSMLDGTSIMAPVASSYAAPGGADVYLRVRIPMPGLEAVVSTVKVTTHTYLADVLDTICKKRKEQLGNAKDWVLMLGDQDVIVPLDRTIESLQGSHNLRLAKKADVADLIKAEARGRLGRLVNRDPSASIFKRLSEPPQPKYVSASDFTVVDKRFIVYRKHAMSLTRHERILSIEATKIEILHPSHEPGRTASFHISRVHDCKPSKRLPNSFKLIVDVNRELKRYDFEAQSHRKSQEIIETITYALQAYRDRQTLG